MHDNDEDAIRSGLLSALDVANFGIADCCRRDTVRHHLEFQMAIVIIIVFHVAVLLLTHRAPCRQSSWVDTIMLPSLPA